jgi:choline kinase
MKGPILVVLAAGMGSRYGGLKQIDVLGKNGEVLLDYSVYDAIRAGVEKIVFIIKRSIENDFRQTVLDRIGSKINWELAFQEADSLIPEDIFKAAMDAGRTKVWGTGHALLCAADKIDAPFAVLNSDDFYGKEAFAVMGKYLCETVHQNSSAPCLEGVTVPYQLEKTLSPNGSVARGVCSIRDGYLVGIEELTSIAKKDGRIINTSQDGAVRELVPETPVSMNFWGFQPDILVHFQKYFEDFLAQFSKDIKEQINRECFIPLAVDTFIKQGIVKVKTLTANSDWFGVTYKEDKETAIKKIEDLTAAGVYPASLW